jgi:hypothetical protein
MRLLSLIFLLISFTAYSEETVVYYVEYNGSVGDSDTPSGVCQNIHGVSHDDGSQVTYSYATRSDGSKPQCKCLESLNNCQATNYSNTLDIVSRIETIGTCEDGYPVVITELGITSCDRNALQTCSDSSVRFASDICDSNAPAPVCSDASTCESYAQSLDHTCVDSTFSYSSPDNFTFTCNQWAVVEPGVEDNPYSEPDPTSATAGDIAGAIQQALAPDFYSIKESVDSQSSALSTKLDNQISATNGIGQSIDSQTASLSTKLDNQISATNGIGQSIDSQTTALSAKLDNQISAINDVEGAINSQTTAHSSKFDTLISATNGVRVSVDSLLDSAPDSLAGTISDDADTESGDAIDTGIDSIVSGIDSDVLDMVSDTTGLADTSGLKDSLLSFFPQHETCTSFSIDSLIGALEFKCDRFEQFKGWFGWALSIFTVIYIFSIALQPSSKE